MENFEKTFTVMGGGTPSSETSAREFKEPIVEIESLNEEDTIMMSGDGFNGQNDYDPDAIWED